MSKLIFAESSWEEYLFWQENDKNKLKRINLLLKDIVRNGNDGIGRRSLN
jgi:toxin YoeB